MSHFSYYAICVLSNSLPLLGHQYNLYATLFVNGGTNRTYCCSLWI